MNTVLLVIHAIIAFLLIGVILMQRSSSDGFGLGSGSGSNSIFSRRGTANFMTRMTAVLATLFMANSLFLAILASNQTSTSIMDLDTGASEPVQEAPVTPEQPAVPSVPLAE